MSERTCSVENCDREAKARGWCSTHYTRWWRHGDPAYEKTEWERFWGKVDASGDCWEWTGYYYPQGYGGFEGSTAHRKAWELLIAPVPDDMTLDHLCRNRTCVNPDHLEVVTRGENTLRGEGITAQNLRKTHCPQGHRYSDANTYIDGNGHRSCRICRNAHARAYTERQRA